MIHVCFGLYDKTGRYAKFTGTAILSLFENTNALPQSITVHILHDNTLTPDNRDKFIYLAGQYNQLVKFYNVEELCADKIKEMVELIPNLKIAWSSIATIYRFLIPRLLPKEIEKIIYLDSDIIVNLDIKELWQVELDDKIFGVIPEIINGEITEKKFNLCSSKLVKPEDYFNAGVLLINLNLFKKEEQNIVAGFRFIAENPQYAIFLDQDVLNYCFAQRTLHLPSKFNRFIRWARWQKEYEIGRKIYHYTGTNAIISFSLDMNDPFNRLWMKYFIKTPWFDETTMGRLYTGFRQVHVELKNAMANISAVMSGKTRAFFTLPQNVEAIKKTFSIRNDELIIRAEGDAPLKKLIAEMKKAHGKKVFFILLPNFPFNVLIKAGFAFGKDFLNGIEFLSDVNGVQLNSYPLIQAM